MSQHTDTYALGVVLLELLTGLQPVLPGRNSTTLVQYMLPHLPDLDALQVPVQQHCRMILDNESHAPVTRRTAATACCAARR